MSIRRALGILIVTTALLRVASACFLGLGNDEAYHSLYAAHPALGYYDHPPMMAWIEIAGLALPGAGASAWALRLGFIVMFAGSTWLLARLTTPILRRTRRLHRRPGPESHRLLRPCRFHVRLARRPVAVLLAPHHGPAEHCVRFERIASADEVRAQVNSPPYEGGARGGAGDRSPARRSTTLNSLLPWFWVGLAWGAAMLSKYHGIFLPMGAALYLVLHRPARRWLAHPGPYLATAVGLLVFSPVIVWNATHGWASFLFQGGRAALGSACSAPTS